MHMHTRRGERDRKRVNTCRHRLESANQRAVQVRDICVLTDKFLLDTQLQPLNSLSPQSLDVTCRRRLDADRELERDCHAPSVVFLSRKRICFFCGSLTNHRQEAMIMQAFQGTTIIHSFTAGSRGVRGTGLVVSRDGDGESCNGSGEGGSLRGERVNHGGWTGLLRFLFLLLLLLGMRCLISLFIWNLGSFSVSSAFLFCCTLLLF
mmetsp:Transcript_12023/g.23148  ORF Transcript_12023/g.23148 Transcript_12023/m.23148 type:complete len:207 (+) Transcript_12023:317-937(+)